MWLFKKVVNKIDLILTFISTFAIFYWHYPNSLQFEVKASSMQKINRKIYQQQGVNVTGSRQFTKFKVDPSYIYDFVQTNDM